MSCLLSKEAQAGTLHILKASGVTYREYEWTGSAWSTPGTGYNTKPSLMYILGWRYSHPKGNDEVSS